MSVIGWLRNEAQKRANTIRQNPSLLGPIGAGYDLYRNRRQIRDVITRPLTTAFTPRTAYAPIMRLSEAEGSGPIVERPQEAELLREKTWRENKFTPLGRDLTTQVPILFAPTYTGQGNRVDLSNYGAGQGKGGWSGYFGYRPNIGAHIVLANQMGGVNPRVLGHEYTHGLGDPLIYNYTKNNRKLLEQPWKWPTNQQLPENISNFRNWSPTERMAEMGVGLPSEVLPQNIRNFYAPVYQAGAYVDNETEKYRKRQQLIDYIRRRLIGNYTPMYKLPSSY